MMSLSRKKDAQDISSLDLLMEKHSLLISLGSTDSIDYLFSFTNIAVIMTYSESLFVKRMVILTGSLIIS